MIGELATGSSFRGLTHYLLHGNAAHPRTAEWTELRNLGTSEPDRAHVEMHATAQENPRAHDPVLHVILSPAPQDQLSSAQWSALADRVLADLQLDEHQALVVLHTDTRVPHLHIAVNRIHPDTHRAWGTWRSKTRLERILRSVERDWGLRRVQGRLSRDHGPDRPPPLSRGQRAQARHRAQQPRVVTWRRRLTPEFREASSWTDLAARLNAHGVWVEARGRGLVVTDGSVYAKASSIHRDFSRGRLEGRFGPYADWRAKLNAWDAAAGVHARYAASPDHPRARAARRALKTTGKSLGWRALAQIRAPLPPAVAAIPLGAVRRARALDRTRDRSWDALARRKLAPAIRRSGSWVEADARLRLYGAWLARRDNHLVVTDGRYRTRLAALASDLSQGALSARFGSWDRWERRRHQILQHVYRLRRAERMAESLGERWTRLSRIIRAHEVRIERYQAGIAELRRVEGRLLRRLRRHLPRRSHAHLRSLLADLRQTPHHDPSSRRPLRDPALRQLSRSARSDRRLRELIHQYRNLSADLQRSYRPARSAGRRLERLRLRARTLNPHHQRHRAEQALSAVLRSSARIGLASLVARASPGTGTALRVVRMLARTARALERAEREH
ncbi:MAG: relaxase/mobilization nuclease domain-containing protein [bacterium]